MATQNRTLGRFDLTDIPPAPRGIPQIEVSFDIDANGIVHVSAKDLSTGKEQKIRIESSSGLSDSEIDRMVQDAKANEAADTALREKIDAKNEADSFIYQVEKSLTDLGDKVDASEKSNIESAITDLRTAMQGDDVAEIKAKTEHLKQLSHKIAEEAYKQQSGDSAGAHQTESTQEGGSDTHNAKDADFEVVDEDK